MTKHSIRKHVKAGRGAALLVVLGVVMVVTIVAFGFLNNRNIDLACGQNMLMRTNADYTAESGLEHARGLILNPQELSSEYFTGATGQQISSGDYYYDVTVAPGAGGVSVTSQYCNYDITCKGYKISGTQKSAESNLQAELRLDPAIAYYSDAMMSRQVSAAMVVNGDLYCNNELYVSGNADGDAFCSALSGSITGQQKDRDELELSWPRVDANDFTSNYSTTTVGSVITESVFGPYDPNRIVYRQGDLEVEKNVTIEGMLLVDGDLTISEQGNYIKAGKALPALYVTGDLTIEEDAELKVEGLVVVDGKVEVNLECKKAEIIGSLFAKQGLVETTKDETDNRRDAAIWSDPVFNSSGKYDSAVWFDGIDDKIEEFDAGSYLNGRNAITVSLWVKSDVTKQNRGIFYTRNGGGQDRFLGLRYDRRGANAGGITASIGTDGGYVVIESSSSIQTTDWQHLALVWRSGQSLKLYVNGVEDVLDNDSGDVTGQISNVEKFVLGCGSKNNYWNGSIDDVQIYDRALDVNDIDLVKDGTPLNGLIAHWELDESGDREVVITAAPAKTAIWYWMNSGQRRKWSCAAGAFFKSIRRN